MLVYFNKKKEVRKTSQTPLYVMPGRVWEPRLSAVGLVSSERGAVVRHSGVLAVFPHSGASFHLGVLMALFEMYAVIITDGDKIKDCRDKAKVQRV